MSSHFITIEEVLGTKFKKLLLAPLGKEQAHAIAVQGVIQLDPRTRIPLGKVLLHELLHVRRPLWSETRVIEWENRLWRNATWQQKAALFQKLGRAEIWDGSEVTDEDVGGLYDPPTTG